MKRLIFILLFLPIFCIGQVTHSSTNYYVRGDIQYGSPFWTDVEFAINGSTSPSTAPDLVEINSLGVYAWGFAGSANNESVALEKQFPHGVADSLSVEVHLHVMPTTAPNAGATAVV